MKLTNNQIYNYASALNNPNAEINQRMPIKVSFYFQKNKAKLTELAQEIDKARLEIIKAEGTLNPESGQYDIDKEKMPEVVKEINDLFTLEQEVEVYMIKLDSLGENIQMTPAQMEALMFMIEE